MKNSICSTRCDQSALMPVDPLHNCAIWDYEHRNPNNYISVKFIRGVLHYATPITLFWLTGYSCDLINTNYLSGTLAYVGLRTGLPVLSITESLTAVTLSDKFYQISSRDEIVKFTMFVNENLGIPQHKIDYNVTCTGIFPIPPHDPHL